MLPENVVGRMDFIAHIALVFIAFSSGEFFRFSKLHENGFVVLVITVLEACSASLTVFAVMFFVLQLNFPFSLILAALASTGSPGSTMTTVCQIGVKGDFVDALLQAASLDNVSGLIAYSTAVSIAMASVSGVFNPGNVLVPIIIILGLYCWEDCSEFL